MAYFDDGKKRIDFILTYPQNIGKDHVKETKLENFLYRLETLGIYLEYHKDSTFKDTVFVKVHCPDEIILKYARIFKIELSKENTNYLKELRPRFRFMGTPLTMPSPKEACFHRNIEVFANVQPTTILQIERTMVLEKIFKNIPFGPFPKDVSYQRLLNESILESAYPLHDSTVNWTDAGPLTDRQLLGRFWSETRNFYKAQPLRLIHQYYGPEVAFYFAWYSFYTRMLLLPALIGGLIFLYGFITINHVDNYQVREVCESNITICPYCFQELYCKYDLLSTSCTKAEITYMNDNYPTLVFSVFIMFWASLFLVMWKRRQKNYVFHWNLTTTLYDTEDQRVEFVDQAYFKLVPGGFIELYTPPAQEISAKVISYSTCGLMASLIITKIFLSMIVRFQTVMLCLRSNFFPIKKNATLIASFVTSTVDGFLIDYLTRIYKKMAAYLTKKENPRTELEYENSYMMKTIFLTFLNNYTLMLYISFIKGKLYTHPGSESLTSFWRPIIADVCDASGCTAEIIIHVFSIMTTKSITRNALAYISPILSIFLKNVDYTMSKVICIKKIFIVKRGALKRWEEDYMLLPFNKLHISNEFLEMILQYSYILCFTGVFPLLPLFALINNLFEIRFDALKLTHRFRRNIPRQVSGIEFWSAVLGAVTVFGVVVNAFIIGLTSEFVPRWLYKKEHNNYKGYIFSTLSKFNTTDFAKATVRSVEHVPEYCYYRGRRHPPESNLKYKFTVEYWSILGNRILFSITLEHVAFLLMGLVLYFFSSTSSALKRKMHQDYREVRELKKKALKETILKH